MDILKVSRMEFEEILEHGAVREELSVSSLSLCCVVEKLIRFREKDSRTGRLPDLIRRETRDFAPHRHH